MTESPALGSCKSCDTRGSPFLRQRKWDTSVSSITSCSPSLPIFHLSPVCWCFSLWNSQIDAFLFIWCGLRQKQRLVTAFPTFTLLFLTATRQAFFKKQTRPWISHYTSMTPHWFQGKALQSSSSLTLYPSWQVKTLFFTVWHPAIESLIRTSTVYFS